MLLPLNAPPGRADPEAQHDPPPPGAVNPHARNIPAPRARADPKAEDTPPPPGPANHQRRIGLRLGNLYRQKDAHQPANIAG